MKSSLPQVYLLVCYFAVVLGWESEFRGNASFVWAGIDFCLLAKVGRFRQHDRSR